MATRPSIPRRNEWTVRLLDIQPTDQVLEIGFGPGLAVRAAARQARSGHVTGVDRSATVVSQARRRNRRAVAQRRVELLHGDPGDVSAPPGGFEKVLALNVFMFWRDPVAELRRIADLTAPDGTVALALQPRARGAMPADAREAGHRMIEAAEQAGCPPAAPGRCGLRPRAALNGGPRKPASPGNGNPLPASGTGGTSMSSAPSTLREGGANSPR